MGKRDSGEEATFRVGNYVRIIDTCDEWQDLIGVVEEFMGPDGNLHPRLQKDDRIVVLFPTDKKEIRSLRLTGVNLFSRFVLFHLKQYEGKQHFDLSSVEMLDPDEL